jgi:Helix-turn-helix domain
MTAPNTTAADASAPRMYTRGDAMRILRIGETSLHWLTRTGKLRAVRIGARVLIPAAEVERLCRKGTTLSEAEKAAARSDSERRCAPRKHAVEGPKAVR